MIRQIMLEKKGSHPYRFEQTDSVAEWIEDRARLARAIGLSTKQTDRLLYILDGDEVLALYYSR